MQKGRRRMPGGAFAGLVTTTTLTMGATPAQAHYTYVYHGSDLATVASDHHGGSVCDRESDGHPVYGEYITESGSNVTVWDCYPGDRACETVYLLGDIDSFRLCEQLPGTDSCTAWKNA